MALFVPEKGQPMASWAHFGQRFQAHRGRIGETTAAVVQGFARGRDMRAVPGRGTDATGAAAGIGPGSCGANPARGDLAGDGTGTAGDYAACGR